MIPPSLRLQFPAVLLASAYIGPPLADNRNTFCCLQTVSAYSTVSANQNRFA